MPCRRTAWKYYNDEYHNVVTANHIGRPLLGQRVEDTLDALEYLIERPEVDVSSVTLTGIGRAAPVALHAAALEARFTRVELRDALASWIDIVAAPGKPNLFGYVVPFALTRYVLPDLARCLEPRFIEFEAFSLD